MPHDGCKIKRVVWLDTITEVPPPSPVLNMESKPIVKLTFVVACYIKPLN